MENCVNTVGVDLNTASFSLLSHVAGISASVAKNIVAWRKKTGCFLPAVSCKRSISWAKKRMNNVRDFCVYRESDDFLDNTAVHPESYEAARGLLRLCGCSAEDLKKGRAPSVIQNLDPSRLPQMAEELGVGLPTMQDIAAELSKPGRDPRDELPAPLLRTDILSMEDLKEGMELRGTVRNVIDFGVFVDIGVHQDGLVHISQISNRFIRHPSEAVKVGDIVTVWVLGVDTAKKRISLTMKRPAEKKE